MSSEPLVKHLPDGTAEVTISRDQAMKLSVEVWANRKLGLETPTWMLDVAALVDPMIRTEPIAGSRKVEWVIAPAVSRSMPAVPLKAPVVDVAMNTLDTGNPLVVARPMDPSVADDAPEPRAVVGRRVKDSAPSQRILRSGATRPRRQRLGR